MSDIAKLRSTTDSSPTRITTQTIPALNGATGKQQLARALATGPSALRQQVRYILALSQVIGGKTSRNTYRPPAVHIRQARMLTLSRMVHRLDATQVQKLISDIEQIEQIDIRLPLLAKFALQLPAAQYRKIVRDVWNQVETIEDPVARADTLYEIAPLLMLVNDEPATPSALLKIVSEAQTMKSLDARVRGLIALAPHLPSDMAYRTFRRVLDDLATSTNDTVCAKSIGLMAQHIPSDLEQRALGIAHSIESPADRAYAMMQLARYVPGELQTKLRQDALEAIDSIENEEARAEALIDFVPNLEIADPHAQFPALLEKALTITIMIGKRQTRARVLVALAPHLTVDLQGEALAAVHSLSSEQERAILLAQLAPTLPADMLVASLAVALTMREQDARVHALSVLAHYVPQHAQSQTMMDALAAASNLPNHFERVQAIVHLIDILPSQLRDQALANALDSAADIQNINARARAFTLLGGHLPAHLLPRALEIIRSLPDPQHRLNAFLGLLPTSNTALSNQLYPELLACAQQMPLEYKRARALISIAPYVPVTMLQNLEQVAEKLDDPIDRVNVAIAIIQNLPPQQRPELVNKAWRWLQRIDDGYDRASALAALAVFLPHDKRYNDQSYAQPSDQLTDAVCKAIADIPDEYDKASAITLLASLLADGDSATFTHLPDAHTAVQQGIEAALSIEQGQLRVDYLARGAELWTELGGADRSYTLWCVVAEKLIHLPLTDAILCLGAMLPIIEEFAGRDRLIDVAYILGVR